MGGSCRELRNGSIVASPGAPGDGEAVIVPSFLTIRVRGFVDDLCKVESSSEVFAVSGDCLRRRVSENTGLTKIGEVQVRKLQRSRVSLLVGLKFSTLTVNREIKRRTISVACRCTRLFPAIRASVTTRLRARERTLIGIGGRWEWWGRVTRYCGDIPRIAEKG